MSKKMFRTLLFVITAALFVCLAYYCYLTDKTSVGKIGLTSYIYICSLTVMCCFSAYYALSGCTKKDGSGFFKLYMFVFAIYELVCLSNHQQETIWQIMDGAIRMSVLVLLARALDLGKKRSLNCTYILLFTTVIDAIALIATKAMASSYFTILLELLLDIVCFLMVNSKYADKATRMDYQLD